MTLLSGKNAFIDWHKRPEVIKEEANRRARENAIHVVKVILPEHDSEATIFREGRMGLKHQELTDEEQEWLNGDRKGHFHARWSTEETKWKLIKRIPDMRW